MCSYVHNVDLCSLTEKLVPHVPGVFPMSVVAWLVCNIHMRVCVLPRQEIGRALSAMWAGAAAAESENESAATSAHDRAAIVGAATPLAQLHDLVGAATRWKSNAEEVRVAHCVLLPLFTRGAHPRPPRLHPATNRTHPIHTHCSHQGGARRQ